LRHALDLAEARSLQLVEAGPSYHFGIAIALPFILGLQARPFVRIDRLHVGSLELAVGRRLPRQERRGRPVNAQFGMQLRGRMDARMRSHANVRCLDFLLNEFAVRRFARASGETHRESDGANGRQSRAQ
jgi:hypothetical protein